VTSVAADDRLDALLNTLADRVRELRRERELTVLALSFEAGISESRVRAIESGRTTASLATLVALAEAFGIPLSELFSENAPGEIHRDSSSVHVVPSEVTWGGELPPAPWMTAAPATPTPSPYVVPSEVVWGGELPAASWTTAKAASHMPEPIDHSEPGTPERVAVEPTERTWAGFASTAPGIAEDSAAAATRSVGGQRAASPSAAAGVRGSASMQGGKDASRYVLVAPSGAAPREPRTFSDLREGGLAGREFDSLRTFAVAAVAEAGYSAVTVARIFRLPVWKLERWVAEAGYVGRR
jgi:DNA-binding XRE family transcriptional regulator